MFRDDIENCRDIVDRCINLADTIVFVNAATTVGTIEAALAPALAVVNWYPEKVELGRPKEASGIFGSRIQACWLLCH